MNTLQVLFNDLIQVGKRLDLNGFWIGAFRTRRFAVSAKQDVACQQEGMMLVGELRGLVTDFEADFGAQVMQRYPPVKPVQLRRQNPESPADLVCET